MVEEEMHDIVQKHGSLLRKGLNLSHVPTVNEVLKRSLPPTPLTPGRFLILSYLNVRNASTNMCLNKNLFILLNIFFYYLGINF